MPTGRTGLRPLESLPLSPTGSTCSQRSVLNLFFFLPVPLAYHAIAVIFHSSHVTHLFVKPIISLLSPVELSCFSSYSLFSFCFCHLLLHLHLSIAQLPLPPPPRLRWCVCPGSGFWWILSCNGQRAAVVSDVCMTCFLPESISSSQPALFFFWVIPCQASCSQPHGACTDRFTPTQPLSCHLRRFDTLLQQRADQVICLWGAQRYVEICSTSL